jgi:hypothetical protein
VRLWDANSGQQLAILLQTDQTVTDAVFVDEAGSQVVAITDEGIAYLIDVSSATVLEQRLFPARLWRAAWNPQANLLAISGRPDEETGESGFLSILLPTFEEPPVSTPMPTQPPTVTPNSTATATPTPPPTATPAAYRLWRIRNSNSVDVVFTWDIDRSPTSQNGFGVAPPAQNGVASEVIISTVTEAGPNTLRLFVDGAQHDVKASSGATCPP